MQGYGTPLGVFVAYALKVALYVGGWVLFCGSSPSLGGPATIASWWLASAGLREGDRLEPALRGPRPRLRERAAHRPLLPAARRLSLLPAPRDDQAAALPGRAAHRRSHAHASSTSSSTLALLAAGVRALARPGPRPRSTSSRSSRCVPLLGVLDKTHLPRRARRALLGHDRLLRVRARTGSPAPRRCSSRSGSGPASPSSTTTSRPSSA